MSVYLPEFMQKLHAERAAEAAQLSRRGFIKLTGLAGGGLVLALSLGPAAKKVFAQPSGAAAFNANPYVQIQPDGKVVLFAKNPEVGQGVKTSLPLIVAEELDADWTQVEVRQSVIDAALYGPQFAGGSLSIPMNFDVLRRAGATARAMLVAAAAKTWNVPAAELTTANSAVRHAASNRSASYGELAELAATMPVPSADSVVLKSKESFRLLGKRFTGVDNDKLVRGEPLFGIDQRVPGMVFATFTKAPAIGARAVSANLDEVRKLPGVKDAFIVGGQGDRDHLQPGGAPPCCPASPSSRNSTWAALQAKKALKVQWDESAASGDSWTGAVAQAKSLATKTAQQVLGEAGNVEAAFAAGKTVEALYTYHYVSHADLEPQNCTAWFKGDNIEIWAPTQTPQNAVDAVAELLGLPKDKVTLHQLRGGGGFGRRLANDSVCEAALISKQAGGIPVKVQWSREDDMAFDYYRAGGFHALKAAVDSGRQAVGVAEPLHHLQHGRQGTGQRRRRSTRPSSRPTCSQYSAHAAIDDPVEDSDRPVARARQQRHCVLRAGLPERMRGGSESRLRRVPGRAHGRAAAARGRSVRWLGSTRAAPSNVIKAVAERSGWGKTMPAGRALGLAFHFSHQGHFAEVADVSVDASKKVTVHKVWVVADIGPIVNLSSAENQCQGSVIDALSTAMGLKITFENGRVEQTNLHQYPIVRMDKAPDVDVHFLDTDYPPTGCGEPAFPPAAPAIANAIFAATGQRVRTLPFSVEGYSI